VKGEKQMIKRLEAWRFGYLPPLAEDKKVQGKKRCLPEYPPGIRPAKNQAMAADV
jgi:hypothetical protein